MNLNINENIKRLRKAKNITQEKLAEHLNVSIQAVSKWERGETFPDISMIIPLASYFGVSTDELLGVDAAKNEARIQEYLDEMKELNYQGKWHEATELGAKAHKEFPNDFRLMHEYTTYIIGGRADHSTENILAHADEVTAICERILDECNIDYIRHEALVTLSRVDKARGYIDKALERLAILPDWFTTCGQVTEQLFAKDTSEFKYWISRNFFELFDFAHNKFLKIIWFASDVPFDKKVGKTLQVADFLLNMIEETNHELLYHLVFATYSEIARQHRMAEKYENVGKYYDIALSYAVKFDKFLASDRENCYITQKFKDETKQKYNAVARHLTWLENNPWFEEARKHENFNAMLEKYKQFT